MKNFGIVYVLCKVFSLIVTIPPRVLDEVLSFLINSSTTLLGVFLDHSWTILPLWVVSD